MADRQTSAVNTAAIPAGISSVEINKVLRNTYMLLGMTLAFSAVVAGLAMVMNAPYPGFIPVLIGFFGLLGFILFNSPLEAFVLQDAMGLRGELRAYCLPALKLAFLMAAAWAYSALFRGLLAGAQNTTMLAVSGLSRIAVAVLIASLGFVFAGANGAVNGAVIGIIAWMAGYGLEAVLLALQLRRMDRRAKQV